MSVPSLSVIVSENTPAFEKIVFELTFKNLYATPSIDPLNSVYSGIVTLDGELATVSVSVPVIDADDVERGT